MKRALLVACLSLAIVPAGAQSRPRPNDDHGLRAFLQTQFRDYRDVEPKVRHVVGVADLNGDGLPEAVVQVLAASYCGSGGCWLHIFSYRRDGWREVSSVSIANAPIRVLNTRSHGWRDLSVRVAGGGIRRSYEARLRFDGRAYPTNPSIPPARRPTRPVPGRVLIADGARASPLF